jgi:preprotein translocase subunit SecG
MYTFLTYSMMFLHMFVGLILIAVILLQRGRGGGLAGAFGGMGGQSAFGTKAGDVFTKITIVLATIWIVLGCVCVLLASNYKPSKIKFDPDAPAVTTAPDEGAGAGEKASDKKDEGNVDKGNGALPDARKPETKPIPDDQDEAKDEGKGKPAETPADKPADATEKPAEPKDKPEEAAKEKGEPAPAKESEDKKPE